MSPLRRPRARQLLRTAMLLALITLPLLTTATVRTYALSFNLKYDLGYKGVPFAGGAIVVASNFTNIGQLTLRSDVRGLPVAQLTVEATVILQQPKINLLQTLTVTLPADASEVFEIGGKRAALVSLRIVDVLLRTAWE